jgi:hypothetical protein
MEQLVKDKTMDPKVPMEVRQYVRKVCMEANREEQGKARMWIITEFEISSEQDERRT